MLLPLGLLVILGFQVPTSNMTLISFVELSLTKLKNTGILRSEVEFIPYEKRETVMNYFARQALPHEPMDEQEDEDEEEEYCNSCKNPF